MKSESVTGYGRVTARRNGPGILGAALLALAGVGGSTACSDPYVPLILEGIRMESGNHQTGVVGGPLPQPLAVAAFNQFGDPIAGARVEFSAPQGSFDQSVKFSAADGVAQATYTLGPAPGPVTVTASTLSGEVVVEFTAVGEMGAPAALRLSSGNNQSGAAGAPLELPLRVRVVNEYGVGYPGIQVLWAPQGQGELSETANVTGPDGYAEVTLTLGADPGAHTVTASVEGFFPVTFTALAH